MQLLQGKKGLLFFYFYLTRNILPDKSIEQTLTPGCQHQISLGVKNHVVFKL